MLSPHRLAGRRLRHAVLSLVAGATSSCLAPIPAGCLPHLSAGYTPRMISASARPPFGQSSSVPPGSPRRQRRGLHPVPWRVPRTVPYRFPLQRHCATLRQAGSGLPRFPGWRLSVPGTLPHNPLLSCCSTRRSAGDTARSRPAFRSHRWRESAARRQYWRGMHRFLPPAFA